MNYDVIVIGSGPGGYVAAIRAAQLNFKVAIVEKAELGGICLNWGCIPTKALMKSAQVYNYVNHANDYGVKVSDDAVSLDFETMIKRSRTVAETMSKGVQFLLKKNKVDIIAGFGKLQDNHTVEVISLSGEITQYKASNIILATGARSRQLPDIPQDGNRIIGYREALTLPKLPETMVIIGSGAIGSEFAYFYASLGTKVTLVEYMPNIVPVEDAEISKQLERSFRKTGIKIMTSSKVNSVSIDNNACHITIKDSKDNVINIESETVLSAVGITANIEGIGLEECGIEVKNGKIIVDRFYNTNIEGVYAIGDIIHGPSLAHVASHEAIVCVEKIAGLSPKVIDYDNIPGCTYTSPEIASVGYTEKNCLEKEIDIIVGKFPFTASGKATASGNRDGMAKIIFEKNTGELLGCHLIGENVTEMIAGIVVARNKKVTGHDIINAIYPHPTISETIMEAAANAYNEAIHL